MSSFMGMGSSNPLERTEPEGIREIREVQPATTEAVAAFVPLPAEQPKPQPAIVDFTAPIPGWDPPPAPPDPSRPPSETNPNPAPPVVNPGQSGPSWQI